MSRQIGILGVCDTIGLVACLRTLLPGDTFKPLSYPQGSAEEQCAWFGSTLRNFDAVVVNAIQQVPKEVETEPHYDRLLKYPMLHFHAFHPDMTYIGRKLEGKHELLHPAYNSSICVWAYINGVPPERTAGFFNADVFAALGYFDEWDDSVAQLSAKFSDTSMNFSRFLLRAKRGGPFMLSSDHPRIAAVMAMAKCIAIDKLGEPASIDGAPLYIGDRLAHLYWPVYPEIGEFYGVRTNYDWDFEGRIMGVSEYVHAIYKTYDQLNLKADEVSFGRIGLRARLDTLLGDQKGAAVP